MLPVNYLAIILAAFACFTIGFLIHGPIAGKLWMRLADIKLTGKEKFSDMIPQLIYNFISNLLTAYVLAVVYLFASTSPYMGGNGPVNGMICAFWIWLGFNVTATSIEVIWMGRKLNLWFFELVSSLICFLAMGAIIAGM